jgi:hypothetical protein
MELDLTDLGFKPVQNPGTVIPGCIHLSKRQTLNTNRAVCVVRLHTLPVDVDTYLEAVRNKVALKVGFLPLFWGLGLQVVLVCPGSTGLETRASDFVAKIDNQWAIIQSVFFVDPDRGEFIEARTWGQLVTGKFQDEIARQLATNYRKRA